MRTMRLSLAGAIIVALLGGTSGAVVAQDDSEAQVLSGEAAVFDGTMSTKNPDRVVLEVGTVEVYPAEGKTIKSMERGGGWEYRLEGMSDPRLSGTIRVIRNEDWYWEGSGRVRTEAARIDNADGSWLGHLTGYMDTEPEKRPQRVYAAGTLSGAGAYEGLTAIIFFDDLGTGEVPVHGMVFPGDPLEAPDYPEPPAE